MPVCDVYRLQAFVDGQLCEAQASVLAEHLQHCVACTRLLVGLQSVIPPPGQVPETVPEGLHGRLLAAVAGIEPIRALDCTAALEFASLRLDCELSLDECQRLNAHLDGCAACARAVGEMGLTNELLRSLRPGAAPAGLLQQIQVAVSASQERAPRAGLWQLWARNAAGMAAAAALLLALLTGVFRAPAPMVAQTPPPPPLVSVAVEKAAASPAPVAVAAAPARPLSFDALRRAALTFTSPTALRPAPRPATVVAATVPAVRRVATPPAVSAPVIAPSPQPAVEVHPAPLLVAALPSRPAETPAPREVATTPPAGVPTPAVTPVATPEPSAPVRVAVVEMPRPTPSAAGTPAVAASPKPARRPTWVSRPASEDREVYAADRDEARLADARRDLDKDIRIIRDAEVKGFVIH